ILPSDDAERSLARWLGDEGERRELVVLHPGTGGSCPGWPTERFLALGELLSTRGIRTVLSVGPQDAEVGRTLERTAAEGRGPALFRDGLEPLLALLRRAALVVSNSTGPLHLAAALGAPTLAFHVPWET